ncbi:MAG: pentapeptide repeat-containing protein [Syntrophobacteraceae bacterium]|nr:pentapeptide repeat-containing protein [Syntrophobacteraceae bacterium]
MIQTKNKRQRASVALRRVQSGILRVKAPTRETGAKFSREQFEVLMKCSDRQDMTEWNEWRKHNPNQGVVLQDVNIAGAHLRGADFGKADFRGANLRGADLSGARLYDFNRRWTDLSGADFSEADLCGTDFRGADLRGANFSRAYLYYTNLSWTDLSGANFNGADLWAFLFRANLTSVDLSRSNRSSKLPAYYPDDCVHEQERIKAF